MNYCEPAKAAVSRQGCVAGGGGGVGDAGAVAAG
jgi:hypothetical protein